ncbi:MAG: peptide deformylase [Candidatus Dasytiphilus stammeri]
MTIMRVLTYPDERLRTIAMPVTKIDTNINSIINSMFETMYAKNGIGLAATQVNIHQQIIVIDLSEKQDEGLVLINPQLLEYSGLISIEEGCLSIPEERAFIQRAEEVKIMALDINGKHFTLKAHSLLAICIQHEMDHLKGKLFIDYLSSLKRNRILSKLKKRARIKNRVF